jgi:hypothetical protein
MRVRAITMDDDSVPATVTVEMTVQEAAIVARLTGSLSPVAVTAGLGDPTWVNASAEVFNCLSGELFNRFWDGGVDDVIPKWPALNRALLPKEDE